MPDPVGSRAEVPCAHGPQRTLCAGLFELDAVVRLPRSLYIQIAINSHQQRLRFMFTWRARQVLFCAGDDQQFATRTDMIRRLVHNDELVQLIQWCLLASFVAA